MTHRGATAAVTHHLPPSPRPSGPAPRCRPSGLRIFSTATFLMVAGSVILAIRQAIRLRPMLPMVVLISATLWLPNEPFIDAFLGF